MMLTNEIEHYMQQWNCFTIRQAKTNKNTIFMICSDMSELLIVMCDVKVFLTFTFTEYGTVLTTILPILFLYLNTVIVTAGDFEP